MSLSNTAQACLQRRHWILLALSGLGGCGGGGGGGVLGSLPGTGGTGLFAQGSIAGFGSVIVNSIKFDDTLATVQIDGATAASADLRLGMVASVQGARGADLTLGVANAIEVWSIAQGPITQVQSGQFSLLGMTVQINAATVFDGLSSAGALTPGLRIKVWGLQAGTDGSLWTATRVAISSGTTVVSTGLVAVSGAQRLLNGRVLSGSGVSALAAGQLVRVQGTLVSSGNGLQVDSIKSLDAASTPVPQGDAELEGLVTAVLSTTRFLLGSVEVDASGANVSPAGARMAVGLRIEAQGSWSGRVLKATQLSVKSEQASQEIEIEAKIEQFTSLANFVVRGQRCDGSGLQTLGNGKASDLKVGVKVKVQGTTMGDVLVLSSLEIES